MISATIRLNAYEAGVLYAALQGKEPPQEDRKKITLLIQKIGNILRRARIAAGFEIPVRHPVPPRKPLVISSGVELLEPRSQTPTYRQPKPEA